ncbi:MAG: iron ABC transporter permease [Reinekea sp.]
MNEAKPFQPVTEQRWLLSILLVSSPVLLAAALIFGSITLPLAEVLAVLKGALSGQLDIVQQQFPRTSAILLYIRLPRVIAAMLAGSALGLAGAVSQGLFRNPLASPDILGISAGSSLGAVIAITTHIAVLHPLIIPGTAITGALLTATLIYLLAMRSSLSRQLLFILLAGLALSSLLNGVISATLLLAHEYEISQFIFWTMGALSGRLWSHVLWPAPFILLIGGWLLTRSHSLNLLALGDHNAHGMGLNVVATQRLLLLSSAALTALAIAIAGPVGFIGLMIPHLVRLIFGSDHRLLLPISAFLGALFLLLCDLLGRILIAPHEIKVGIITSLIGGSYFLFLIFRIQQRGRL